MAVSNKYGVIIIDNSQPYIFYMQLFSYSPHAAFRLPSIEPAILDPLYFFQKPVTHDR